MAQMATIRDQTSIMSPPGKVYNFFKNDVTQLNTIAPQVVNSAKVVEGKQGQPGGTVQYELFVFGEKVTVKLKAEKIDDSKRSLTFSVLRDNNKNSTTAMMIKINVADDKITWSLQFADSKDVSEEATRVAKTIIDLIIKALDLYLQFS